jgi:predicted nucleotidyltransferase
MNLFEGLEIHDTLNQDLFDEHDKMKPDIRKALLKVLNYFVTDYIDFDIPVIDAQVVGSNASFNYTSTSDIDLHIITNFSQISSLDTEMISMLFQFEKSRFNKDYDISIKGHQVEVYVEDIRSSIASNGIYSILRDDWVKEPKKINAKIEDTSEDVEQWKNDIDDSIVNGTAEDVIDCINRLYLMRKDSIATEGEYGYGNQVFKDIRNLGLLDKLKDRYHELKSSDLTLEDLQKF